MTLDTKLYGLQFAFEWLVQNRRMVLPHNFIPGFSKPGLITWDFQQKCVFSETTWDAWDWNPPQRYITSADYQAGQIFTRNFSTAYATDPEASPKPSWKDVFDAERHSNLERNRGAESDIENYAGDYRDIHEETKLLTTPSGPVYIGKGLNHMGGLLAMVEEANESGKHLPRVTLKTGEAQASARRTKALHTQRQLRDVLDPVAERENDFESAKNALDARVQSLVKTRDDTSNNLDEREAAFDELRRIADDYAFHLDTEITKHQKSKHELPNDIDDLRGVYLDRIEAEALRRIEDIKLVVTRQGSRLHPSCDDEKNAVQKISELRKLGAITLTNAATAADLTTAYDAAIAAMDSVTALKVPIFKDTDDTVCPPVSDVNAETPFNLRVEHPEHSQVPGQIAPVWAVEQAADGAGIKATVVNDDEGNFRHLRLRITPPETEGETAKYTIWATNLCGRSKGLKLSVTKKTEPPTQPTTELK